MQCAWTALFLLFVGPKLLGSGFNHRRENLVEIAAFKYRAFLSYSHRDTRWAKWLHRALEGYHIDKDFIGCAGGTAGPVPKSMRPIFRDREDFAGGHILTN